MPSLCFSVTLSFLFFQTIAGNINPGTTLRASNPNDIWSSPSKNISFRFTQSQGLYVAGISFSGITIWTAGGDSVGVDVGGTLTFLSTGNLQLLNGSGDLVWESGTGNRGITVASLEDSGNFALKNGTFTVWETFNYPTDTILQNQGFKSEQKLTSGVFSFSLLSSGNLSLTWNNSINYWNQRSNSSFNLSSPSLVLQSIGILVLSDPSISIPVIIAYCSDYAESDVLIRFIKLDKDGNLRAYSYGGSGGVSILRWTAVQDQCEVYGWCGNMGICSYNDTGPICMCPSANFEFADPEDPTRGCRRLQELEDCPNSSTMLELDHAMFLTYGSELSNELYTGSITAIKGNCLSSSTCVASTSLSDGSGFGYLKISDFISGYQSPKLSSTSFVKVCAPALPNQIDSGHAQSRNRSKLTVGMVVLVVVSTAIALVSLEIGLWWWCRDNPKFGGLSLQYSLLEYASGTPLQFSFKDLHYSTKGFKEKLGSGGFGAVYKGVLPNKTIVAVKQLEGIAQGERQFRMEVATISSTHHLNLVRLIGFCSEGRHRLLVYEFMRNGSLDNFLFSDEQSSRLDWDARFNIALGTARGITYLHEECRDCIVHCDIKPENILLDENFGAKVSDFGLAKLINTKDHRYLSLASVRGTRGYLAPEWIANLPIVSKSDVYSYGMVLLEIISGHRNFDVSAGGKKFSTWAYEEFDRGSIGNIVDRKLGEEVEMEQLNRAIQVSFWCIQEQPSQRPAMGKVVQMLEGIVPIEKPPAPKAIEGSLSSISTIVSGTPSAVSTFAASAPAVSSV